MNATSSHTLRRTVGIAVICSILAGGSPLFSSIAPVVPLNAFQLLPPPGDREIRGVYWELRNESEVWLTLEPANAKGDRAPLLTFTIRFPGKVPVRQPTDVEMRAYAGMFWAPRVEFWFLLNDTDKIELVPSSGTFGLTEGTPSDYLSETVPIDTLKRIASARRITGNALGFEFELTGAQRIAINVFLERIQSATPIRHSEAK
jgi:hypothetical protein